MRWLDCRPFPSRTTLTSGSEADGQCLTFKGTNQWFGVESRLGRPRAAVRWDCAVGEGIDKVAHNEVLAREVLGCEAGPLRKESAGSGSRALCGLTPRPRPVHGQSRRICDWGSWVWEMLSIRPVSDLYSVGGGGCACVYWSRPQL